MKYNGTADNNNQPNQQLLTTQQKIQVPQRQISATDNNNHHTMDISQARRASRAQDNLVADKSALTLDATNIKQTSETHYIKNKALQSPVNRYKVNIFKKHACIFSGTPMYPK